MTATFTTLRITADVDELARARRVAALNTAAVLPTRRAERRRRLAEPDLDFRDFCARTGMPTSSTPQLERAWDAWQPERYRRGETDLEQLSSLLAKSSCS